MKRRLRGPNGLTIRLDTDLSQRTPIMVSRGKYSATFSVARETEVLTDGEGRIRELTPEEGAWLEEAEQAVKEILNGRGE